MRFDPTQATQLLQVLAQVSDDYRNFSLDAEVAGTRYGLRPNLLERLIESGLPHRRREDGMYLDAMDVSNIGLHLRLPSIQRLAMRSWAQTLRRSDAAPCIEADIAIHPMSAPPDAEPLKTLHVALNSSAPPLPSEAIPLLEDMLGFAFFMLPEHYRWDTEFISRHHICDCGGGSKLLHIRAQELGLTVRHCFGLLIAEPYSTGHYWVEFLIGDEWIPFDPLLIALLHHVAGLPAATWPPLRSTRVAFHRLCIIEGYGESGAPLLKDYADVPGNANPALIMEGQTMVVTLPTVLKASNDVSAHLTKPVQKVFSA